MTTLGTLLRDPVFPPRKKAGGASNTPNVAYSPLPSISAKVFRLSREAVWGRGNPAALSIDAAFKVHEVAAIRHFKERTYHPKDSILVVIGPVSISEVVAQARESFGAWVDPAVRSDAEVPETPPISRPKDTVRITALRVVGGATWLSVDSACTGATDPDDVAFELLSNLLESLAPSAEFGTLRLEHADSYVFHANCEERRKAGTFTMAFDSTPANAEKSLRVLLDGLARLRAFYVSNEDLERAKARFLGRWQSRLSHVRGIARAVTGYFLEGLGEGDISTLEARVRAVTPARIRDVARRYLGPERLAIVVAGDPRELDLPLQRVGTVTWVNAVDRESFPSQYWDEFSDDGQ